MKDGTTHLAYKAEHVVDLETDLIILAAEIRPTTDADTQTLADSVLKAERDLCRRSEHSRALRKSSRTRGITVPTRWNCAKSLDLRTYIPEPKRKDDRVWTETWIRSSKK